MAYPRSYNASSKFKASKPFTMDGKDYTFDDPVDVTGIEPRRVRLMFDARLIDVDERPDAKRKAAPKPAPAPKSEAARSYRIKNGGFGRWYIADASGENVSGPFEGEGAKAKAEAALAQMQ